MALLGVLPCLQGAKVGRSSIVITPNTKRPRPEPKDGSVRSGPLSCRVIASDASFGSTVVVLANGSSAVIVCYFTSPPSRVIESQEWLESGHAPNGAMGQSRRFAMRKNC
jgi:hypothetical protein